MIFVVKSTGPRSCFEPLLGDAAAPRIELLQYDDILAASHLRRGTYVFTDFDRLRTEQLVEAARVFRRLQDNGCRVLNDPARVRTRFALLRKLHTAGVNPFNAYLAEEGVAPTRFPVFIRVADGHDGALSDLIADQASLDVAIDAVVTAGYPRSTILIVEYAAQPIRPGVFRKMSVHRVGARFIPDLCWHGTDWHIKGDRHDIVDEELFAEELEIVRDNRFADSVEEAFSLANIDFGRIDFGFVDGRICVYEINTYPTFFGVRWEPSPQRLESVTLKWAGLLEALHSVDTPQGETDEWVEVTGNSVTALEKADAISSRLRSLRLRLCEEEARRGNVARALDLADASLTDNPDDIRVLKIRGELLARQDRLEEALKAWRRIAERKPHHKGARRRVADLLMRAGRFEEARDRLLADLAAYGDDWAIHHRLSLALTKLGKDQAALAAAQRAAELMPNEPKVVARLQEARRQKSLMAQAIRKAFGIVETGRSRLGRARKWVGI